MHYNLLIKKQRRRFWQDCEKAIKDSVDYNPAHHSWNENGKNLSPSGVYSFWDTDGVLWDEESDYDQNISKNAYDTFDFYEINDVEEFDDI